MKLHHIAFWTHNIETLRNFYEVHFNGKTVFRQTDGGFESIFISIFENTHLELMTRPGLQDRDLKNRVGHSHISVEVQSQHEVDRLTDYFIENKIPLEKTQVLYDDGFYETSVFDPDGNIIEVTYINRSDNNTV